MSKASILIADDDRLVLATLASGFRKAGYTIYEANDGEEAIRLSETEQPDIAILDIRMPNVDGIEAASHICNTPFVMLTAYEDKELIEKITNIGALGYLVKPICVAQMIPTIETALKRSAQIKKLQVNESRLVQSLKNDQITSMAVGVIMERHKLSRDVAFDKLRNRARSQRRKINEVADDLLKAAEKVNFC